MQFALLCPAAATVHTDCPAFPHSAVPSVFRSRLLFGLHSQLFLHVTFKKGHNIENAQQVPMYPKHLIDFEALGREEPGNKCLEIVLSAVFYRILSWSCERLA